jgi:excisionase family DNA binding protein
MKTPIVDDVRLPRFIPRTAAARSLGVSTQTVDKLIATGKIEAIRVGDLKQIAVDSVERYIRAARIAPKNAAGDLVAA